MLTRDDITQLIHLRIPEAEARATLESLTPDQVDADLFRAFLSVMAETCVPLPKVESMVLDCCGTGGSGLSHYNTSTTVAFVLAAGGVPVVKFGNRGMTSQSGSFDFLEGLGFPRDIPLDRLDSLLEEAGLVFLFAPQCYPQLGAFNTLRRSLSVKTIFNFIGPLLHPLKPAYRVMGVSSAHMQKLVADVLAAHPQNRHAWIVRGDNNLDELRADGLSHIYKIQDNAVSSETYHANGVTNPAMPASLSVQDNLKIFQGLVDGDDISSIYYRMVCINAAAGFVVTGKTGDMDEGIRLAEGLLSSGAVAASLNRCRRAYAKYPG